LASARENGAMLLSITPAVNALIKSLLFIFDRS
jgi:hypothetical protein